MPYKSPEQAAYMHIHHPEIAAEWDKKYGKPKKRKVKKSRAGVLRELGTTAYDTGGAVGHPTSQTALKKGKRIKRRIRKRNAAVLVPFFSEKRGKAKKKGRVEKKLITSDDPYFNQRAAQQAFDMVMKMDDDTAEMFTYIVASDLFEETVEKNLGSLQSALNKSFDHRSEMLKRALIRTAQSTTDSRVVEYAKALRQLEEVTKDNAAYKHGQVFREADVRRDPTGRFAVEVHHTMGKPLKKETAEQVIGSYGKEGLDDDMRAQYQDEYRQVSAFLAGIKGVGAGNVDVIYHQRDKAGNTFAIQNNTGRVPTEMLEDSDTRLIGIEAKPTTLTVGGAAYGLMGGLTGNQVERAELASNLAKPAVEQWGNAGQPQVSNSRMFNRLQTTGSFVNQVGAPGSKTQLAGKFAEIVGQYGPEAEAVIGPSTRKTAYRYRGTEKTPEKLLGDTYGREILDAKVYGVEPEEEMDRRLLGFGTKRERARGDFIPMAQRRATGAREQRGEAVTPAIGQMGVRREGLLDRAPTWPERGAGAAIVADYLRQKLPDKHLYRLHLEAGNTPPSEGVIINDKGQLASQAVGYGDDHYVPFNLKNLKALKGGEYIRNRSVGGPTSEDIYTGLMGGARRMTVVSRSGTFTIEFNEDFRGGRRHNDKARRMTRRYEQLLDAVQSGKVDRQTIPARWRHEIENEVKADYPNQSRAVIRELTDDRIKEFKENPQIEGRDLDRAEAMISREEQRAMMGEISEQDVRDFRKGVMNELHNMKEVRFRLNGIGYEAALKSLQEQFPYYIKSVKTNPTRDEELLEFELDEGYVEPGRNRPTKARAGLHGTKENPAEKFSASQADYQRGRTGKKGAFQALAAPVPGAAATPETPTSTNRVLSESEERNMAELKRKDSFAMQQNKREFRDATITLRDTIKASPPKFEGTEPAWFTMDDTDFNREIDNKEFLENFYRDVEHNAADFDKQGGVAHFNTVWARARKARAMVNQIPFESRNADQVPLAPFSFPNEQKAAYHAGATAAQIAAEQTELNTKKAPHKFTTTKDTSEMDDDEMKVELDQLKFLSEQVSDTNTPEILLADNRRLFPGSAPPDKLAEILKDKKAIDKHKENLHRARWLKIMEGHTSTPAAAPASGGGSTSSSAGGSTGGQQAPPSGGGQAPPSGQSQPSGGQSGPPATPRRQATGGLGGPINKPRQIRLNDLDKATKALDKERKSPTSGTHAAELQRTRLKFDAFKLWLDKRKDATPEEMDAEIDAKFDDDEKLRIAGMYVPPTPSTP